MSDLVCNRKQTTNDTGHGTSVNEEIGNYDMSVSKSCAETSVIMESSIYKSSEEYFEYSCDPCNAAGDHFEAQGFCTDCDEYLCDTCFRCHSRGKATRSHTLQDKINMPRRTVKTCDPCKTADEEKDAIGYCENCREYLCCNCFKSHSRSKATKHHDLIDKDSVPTESANSALAFSVTKRGINKASTRYPRKTNEVYTYIRDVSCKAKSDKENCYIIAMSLVSSTELVLADYENKSLKLVDIESNIITAFMELQSNPTGLTSISKENVAVPLPNIFVIQIITVSEKFSVQKNIKLMDLCSDIEYRNGNIYASFSTPINIKILKPSCEECRTISPDSEVLNHCMTPRYIAVNADESLIYVSDSDTKNVFCIDMNGNLKYKYHSDFGMPVDITISPFGSVYLCDRRQHAMYMMTPDLSEAVPVLGVGDGLIAPHALCFHSEKQHLFISSGSKKAKHCNYLRMFKWQ